MPAPPNPAITPRDLSHAELEELEALLDDTPEALQPLDLVMLEGYLCGVLVQPTLIDASLWLPPIYDLDGAALPESVDSIWKDRVTALLRKYHAALNRRLVDPGWFDPLVFEADGEPPKPQASPEAKSAAPSEASPRTFEPLWPWMAGFQYAVLRFPDLAESDDEAVAELLERLFRHLPAQTDEDRQQLALMSTEFPLATLDDAVEDMVLNIVELFDLTHGARYKVQTVKRAMPKVGRNEACSCGSGRKYKHCHGA